MNVRMIYSRRRLFTVSIAAAATGASGLDAMAKGSHAKHGHAAVSHGHAPHAHAMSHAHGRHGRVLASNAYGKHSLHAKPHIAKNTFTGDKDCPQRRVCLHNLHTDEKINTVYYEEGQYLPDALHAVNHVLRDFRNGEVHQIDRNLLDLVGALGARVGTRAPFQVISGYRSPKTNAMLQEEHEHSGVATHSLHMEGEAMDIRLADVALDHLRNAAFGLQRGGVGYYPASDFVHVDVGDVRHWGFSA